MLEQKEIEVKGYKVHYVDIGQGEIILLLPSTLILLKTYDETIIELSKHFRVISVEPPGVGDSSGVEAPWSFEEYSLWLKEFFITMDIKKCSLIGHSDSGAIVLITASVYPEFIDKLILADTVGSEQMPLTRILPSRVLDGVLEPKLSISALSHGLKNAVAHTKNFLYQIELASITDLKDYMREIKAPTLIAWGKYDHTMPVSSIDNLKVNIPNNKVHISESGSHDWCITEPKEFTKVVFEFVKENNID